MAFFMVLPPIQKIQPLIFNRKNGSFAIECE